MCNHGASTSTTFHPPLWPNTWSNRRHAHPTQHISRTAVKHQIKHDHMHASPLTTHRTCCPTCQLPQCPRSLCGACTWCCTTCSRSCPPSACLRTSATLQRWDSGGVCGGVKVGAGIRSMQMRGVCPCVCVGCGGVGMTRACSSAGTGQCESRFCVWRMTPSLEALLTIATLL